MTIQSSLAPIGNSVLDSNTSPSSSPDGGGEDTGGEFAVATGSGASATPSDELGIDEPATENNLLIPGTRSDSDASFVREDSRPSVIDGGWSRI